MSGTRTLQGIYDFFDTHRYSYDLTELGRYYRLYQRLMAHWHRVLPGFICDVSYEALVEDQEQQTRRLLAHCGLEWDDACLSFHQSARAVKTASSMQVRRPLYKDAVRHWERYRSQLAPLLDALGVEDNDAAGT